MVRASEIIVAAVTAAARKNSNKTACITVVLLPETHFLFVPMRAYTALTSFQIERTNVCVCSLCAYSLVNYNLHIMPCMMHPSIFLSISPMHCERARGHLFGRHATKQARPSMRRAWSLVRRPLKQATAPASARSVDRIYRHRLIAPISLDFQFFFFLVKNSRSMANSKAWQIVKEADTNLHIMISFFTTSLASVIHFQICLVFFFFSSYAVTLIRMLRVLTSFQAYILFLFDNYPTKVAQ